MLLLDSISPYHRRERNIYAKQLLKMLKSGKLEDPFTLTPPPGPLRTHRPGLLRISGETEAVMSSSPLSTFLKPQKSVPSFVSRPSSLLSTHRPGGDLYQFSPLPRATSSQHPLTTSSVDKTAERQAETAENLFSLPEEISHPLVSTASREERSVKMCSLPREQRFCPSLTSSIKEVTSMVVETVLCSMLTLIIACTSFVMCAVYM